MIQVHPAQLDGEEILELKVYQVLLVLQVLQAQMVKEVHQA